MNWAFWQFIHDRLERAWHWVYFEKLRSPENHLKHMRVKNFVIDRVDMGIKTQFLTEVDSREIKVECVEEGE